MLIDTGWDTEAAFDRRLIERAGLVPLGKVAPIHGIGGGAHDGRIWLGDLSIFTLAGETLKPDVEIVELPAITEQGINGTIGMGLVAPCRSRPERPGRDFHVGLVICPAGRLLDSKTEEAYRQTDMIEKRRRLMIRWAEVLRHAAGRSRQRAPAAAAGCAPARTAGAAKQLRLWSTACPWRP